VLRRVIMIYSLRSCATLWLRACAVHGQNVIKAKTGDDWACKFTDYFLLVYVDDGRGRY